MGIASRIARNWSGVRLVPEDHLRLQTAQQDVLEVRQWDFVVEPQLDVTVWFVLTTNALVHQVIVVDAAEVQVEQVLSRHTGRCSGGRFIGPVPPRQFGNNVTAVG